MGKSLKTGNLRHAYTAQRAKAETRGIEWRLTYPQWLAVWKESGRLPDRGTGNGKYVMARNGDSGAYRLGNVRIVLSSENILEYWAVQHYRSGVRWFGTGKHPDLNFSAGRIDLMDPLEILEAAEEGILHDRRLTVE